MFHVKRNMETEQTTWKGAALAGGVTTHGVGSAGTLTANQHRLSIESKVGSFSFSPKDIVRIERSGFLPWFWSGIRLRHSVTGYPEEIGFCPRGASSRKVMKILQSYGYRVA